MTGWSRSRSGGIPHLPAAPHRLLEGTTASTSIRHPRAHVDFTPGRGGALAARAGTAAVGGCFDAVAEVQPPVLRRVPGAQPDKYKGFRLAS